MNFHLKNKIEQMYRLCDTLENSLEYIRGVELPLRYCLKKDLMRYICFLAGEDNCIAQAETEFLSDYLDTDMSPSEIREYIRSHQIDQSFLETCPVILQVVIQLDNLFYDAPGEGLNESVSNYFVELYDDVGKEFLACDEEVTREEMDNYTEFSQGLWDLVNTEVKRNAEKNLPDQNAEEPATESERNQLIAEETLEELHGLTGLEEVKADVNSMINLLQIQKLRKARGLKLMPMSKHLVLQDIQT